MILITGGLGFVGAHTTKALLDLGEACVVAHRGMREPPDFLTGYPCHQLIAERMDCTDFDSVLAVGKRHEITGIVHLAAASMGQGTALDELQANTLALFAMVRAGQHWGVGRMVLASTIGVYGGITAATYFEDLPLPVPSARPIQATKKSAEILAYAAGDQPGVVSARIGAIWGPLGRESSPFFAAPQLIHAAAVGREPPGPASYADDGIDMCYARDCGRAIALLQTSPGVRHRTYNVAMGQITTNGEVADALRRVVPEATPVLAQGRRPGGPPYDANLDIGRLREDTGFRPDYDLESGIADYVAWLRQGHPR
jgi:UDP-glucose 4-epimerase